MSVAGSGRGLGVLRTSGRGWSTTVGGRSYTGPGKATPIEVARLAKVFRLHWQANARFTQNGQRRPESSSPALGVVTEAEMAGYLSSHSEGAFSFFSLKSSSTIRRLRLIRKSRSKKQMKQISRLANNVSDLRSKECPVKPTRQVLLLFCPPEQRLVTHEGHVTADGSKRLGLVAHQVAPERLLNHKEMSRLQARFCTTISLFEPGQKLGTRMYGPQDAAHMGPISSLLLRGRLRKERAGKGNWEGRRTRLRKFSGSIGHSKRP